MQALIKGETQVDQASRDGSGAVRVRTHARQLWLTDPSSLLHTVICPNLWSA